MLFNILVFMVVGTIVMVASAVIVMMIAMSGWYVDKATKMANNMTKKMFEEMEDDF